LNEIASVLREKKIDEGVLGFAKHFRIGQLLKSFSDLKQHGYSMVTLIVKLILIRLGGLSIYAEQKTGSKTLDENILYRLMNNSQIDWRKMLMSFAKRFIRIIQKNCESIDNQVRCFIIDDTLLEKTGRTIEGFKQLLLGYFDGKMLIPCDMSLHCESKKNNYGLNKNDQKKQFITVRSCPNSMQ
ncbi:MAG: transposase, partial [Bacteroidales bacterium]|jgi:hypothetical protein|nr:transposase [Bacteroidales bacterium]